MSEHEHEHEEQEQILIVRAALSSLRLLSSHLQDDDLSEARAHLENWLAANDERWGK